MFKRVFLGPVLFVFALCLAVIPAVSAKSAELKSSEKDWFQASSPVREILLEKILAEPGLTLVALPGGYDWVLGINDTPVSYPEELRRQGVYTDDEMEDILIHAVEASRQEGIPYPVFREIAMLMKQLDLGGFAYVYGHDELGRSIWLSEPDREPIGIEFYPTWFMSAHWYYSLNELPPPSTAHCWVTRMSGNWYLIAP